MSIKNLLLLILLLAGRIANAQDYSVEHKGALHEIMHKGDVNAKITLEELRHREHLYAIGAVEHLKGEIMVIDGKPFVSSVEKDSLVIDTTFTRSATLLVYAQVSKWKAIPIPKNVETYAQLESFIYEAALVNGIDIDKPFPFLLNGEVKAAEWHTVNWTQGSMEHSHENHKKSGLHGTIRHKEVEIVGFYSKRHHTIFTHHTSNMHLHVKTKVLRIVGHLDNLVIHGKLVLYLPEI